MAQKNILMKALIIVVPVLLSTGLASDDWDFFVFELQWPPGIAIEASNMNYTFNITHVVKGWVVHGLWPTRRGTYGPNDCNTTQKFDFNKIANLSQELEALWPNLYVNTPTKEFWEHEWYKHGTCATSLPAIGDEYGYFSTSLNLAKKYNLLDLFGQKGITPSDKMKYDVNLTYAALESLMNNYKTVFQCIKQKDPAQEVMYTVQICFDKQFNLTDCDPLEKKDFVDCQNAEEVLYAPIVYPNKQARPFNPAGKI